jgi:ppGpp synthetase/RelA/SpoT-type nucleotidyltranferase
MPLTASPAEFLQQHGLSPDALEKSGLKWDSLLWIYSDHEKNAANLEVAARYIVEQLRSIPEVHSLRYRVKSPEHLIEKIIRKTLQRPELVVTPENYRDVITDLVGIRALHLFKDDWLPIHQFISATWNLKESPTANLRLGDFDEIFKHEKCEIFEHKAGYRSVHYLIIFNPTKEAVVAEVQVRTLFEEAWSEIDHRIRYPHAVDNEVLAQFLVMFNRLAGSADEMGTYVKFLEAQLSSRELALREATEKHDKAVADLEEAIARSKMDATEKAKLEKQVKELSAETKRTYGNITVSGSPNLLIGGLPVEIMPTITTSGILSGLTLSVCDQCKSPFTPIADEQLCPSCRRFSFVTAMPIIPPK